MKKIAALISLLGFLLLITTGCPKPTPSPPTSSELLSTPSQWQISSVTSNNISQVTENFRIGFTAGGTYSITNPDGVPQPNNTNANTATRTSGSWSFNNNESPTMIIFDSADTANISGLSAEGVTFGWTNSSLKTTPTYTVRYTPAN